MKNKSILIIFILLIIVILFFANNIGNIRQIPEINKNLLLIPVDVYVIKYNDEQFSSLRDQDNIVNIFNNVDKIWSQANIKVDIKRIDKVVLNNANYYYDLNALLSYMAETGNYNQNRINAYFAKTLHGSNGIAFPGNRIMVADKTSVFDFRATSHEIGHVLGLQHVGPVNRLMASGVNGFDLSSEEAEIARKNAIIFISE